MMLRMRQKTATLNGKTGIFLTAKPPEFLSPRAPWLLCTLFCPPCLLISSVLWEVFVSDLKWFPPVIVLAVSSLMASCSCVSKGWTDSGNGWAKSEPRGKRTWLGTWKLFWARSNGLTRRFFEAGGRLLFSIKLVTFSLQSSSNTLRHLYSIEELFSLGSLRALKRKKDLFAESHICVHRREPAQRNFHLWVIILFMATAFCLFKLFAFSFAF